MICGLYVCFFNKIDIVIRRLFPTNYTHAHLHMNTCSTGEKDRIYGHKLIHTLKQICDSIELFHKS